MAEPRVTHSGHCYQDLTFEVQELSFGESWPVCDKMARQMTQRKTKAWRTPETSLNGS